MKFKLYIEVAHASGPEGVDEDTLIDAICSALNDPRKPFKFTAWRSDLEADTDTMSTYVVKSADDRE